MATTWWIGFHRGSAGSAGGRAGARLSDHTARLRDVSVPDEQDHIDTKWNLSLRKIQGELLKYTKRRTIEIYKKNGAISTHYGIVVVGKRIRSNYYNHRGDLSAFPGW
jgi:hypothetical protein